MKAILGIDYGERRLGIAVSDPDRIFTFPLETIDRRLVPDIFSHINTLITTHNIGLVVIGIPLSVEGKETDKSRKIRQFAKTLSRKIPVEIKFCDEARTTVRASQVLRKSKKKMKQHKSKLDMIAASLILRNYLDSQDCL